MKKIFTLLLCYNIFSPPPIGCKDDSSNSQYVTSDNASTVSYHTLSAINAAVHNLNDNPLDSWYDSSTDYDQKDTSDTPPQTSVISSQSLLDHLVGDMIGDLTSSDDEDDEDDAVDTYQYLASTNDIKRSSRISNRQAIIIGNNFINYDLSHATKQKRSYARSPYQSSSYHVAPPAPAPCIPPPSYGTNYAPPTPQYSAYYKAISAPAPCIPTPPPYGTNYAPPTPQYSAYYKAISAPAPCIPPPSYGTNMRNMQTSQQLAYQSRYDMNYQSTEYVEPNLPRYAIAYHCLQPFLQYDDNGNKHLNLSEKQQELENQRSKRMQTEKQTLQGVYAKDNIDAAVRATLLPSTAFERHVSAQKHKNNKS